MFKSVPLINYQKNDILQKADRILRYALEYKKELDHNRIYIEFTRI